MRKIVIALIISAVISASLLLPAGAVYAKSPGTTGTNASGTNAVAIDAKAYILIDSASGRTICENNADMKLYPASTTKILTAIVALEKGKPDAVMTASEEAVYDIGDGGMNIGIMPGEQLRMEDLLNAMLIASANETANIIAENIGPTRKSFMDAVNRKAAELGATGTHFTNPCGMHDTDHYTTAGDMARFARYAMTLPEFRKIVSRTEYNMPQTNKHSKWNPLYSTNKLLGTKSAYYADVNGIKTGYTSEAKNNLIASAVGYDGMELISVVMGVGQPSAENVFGYTKDLLEYGFRNFSKQRIVAKGQYVKSIKVLHSEKNSAADLVTGGGIEAVLPKDRNAWGITSKVTIDGGVKAPVRRGQVLGRIEYFKNGSSIGSTNLIASKPVFEAKNLMTLFRSIWKAICSPAVRITAVILLILAAVFTILRLTLRKISRSRARTRRLRRKIANQERE